MAKDSTVASVRRRVHEALKRTGLAPGGRLVAAVSGGPDSLSMLDALADLRNALDLRLHAAHLDHGLRGDASREDAVFVEELCRKRGIPCTVERADTEAFRQRRHLSLEQAARQVRYGFLARVASGQGAHAIAVAHTSDDQAETVLMHVIRGSGLTGLRGMAELTHTVFDSNEATVVRPILSVSRRDTEAYCHALGLEPRLDETNLSLKPARNRVRSELLPLLEQYNPAVREALVRLSRSAARDAAYIESAVDEAWDRIARRDEAGVSLDRSAFQGLAPAIQSHLLRRAVRVVKGDLEDVEQNHVDGMARLMAGSAGRSLDLPGGVRFSVGYDRAWIASGGCEELALPPLEGEHTVQVPGQTVLPGWRIVATISERGKVMADPAASLAAVLDYDSVGENLRVRPRKRGDRFQPKGMPQPKKLQDFMVDSRIPRSLRDRVPLVVSERGIAWVVGWRIAEWARPRDEGGLAVELRFLPRA